MDNTVKIIQNILGEGNQTVTVFDKATNSVVSGKFHAMEKTALVILNNHAYKIEIEEDDKLVIDTRF